MREFPHLSFTIPLPHCMNIFHKLGDMIKTHRSTLPLQHEHQHNGLHLCLYFLDDVTMTLLFFAFLVPLLADSCRIGDSRNFKACEQSERVHSQLENVPLQLHSSFNMHHLCFQLQGERDSLFSIFAFCYT